jgi:hypothetical protein
VSGVFQNIDPPPPSPPNECVLPPNQGRGCTVHTRRVVGGGWGANILKDARHWIGLVVYSIISLRGTTWTGDLKCREVKNWILSKDKCKPVLLGLSLAGNLVKPLLSLYETEWRKHWAMDSEHSTGHPSIGYKIVSIMHSPTIGQGSRVSAPPSMENIIQYFLLLGTRNFR